MITKTSTKDMSHEQWLEARRKSIGGSDAASILGLNQYNSAYALWCEKTGKITPEDISDKEAVRLGNDLEQYAAERFMDATGKKVRRENNIIYNDDYPFAHANPDRMVIGEKAGLECKTTSSWDIAQKLRAGKIPEHWYCQCVHYLMVTGCDRWYLGGLAFGVGFFHFTIERNNDEIAALAQAEKDFWGCVTNNAPPALDGSQATTDALKTIYADSRPGTAVDLTAVSYHIDAYNALTAQIKELETQRADHENNIKDWMGDAEKGSCGNVTISWKSASRSTFDRKTFEAENGKIPDRYYKTTPTRTFRVTVKKGA